MPYKQILRHFFLKGTYKTYLEIGVAAGDSYRDIPAEVKIGVDPWPLATLPGVIQTTSDAFFATNRRRFDLCFIDGYHSMDQALRDAMNAVRICRMVVLHDTMPPGPETATPAPTPGGWHGEVWKVCEYFRRTGVHYWTVDADFGVTIVPKQQIGFDRQVFDEVNSLTWRYFVTHKDSLLNLVSVEWFLDQPWE